MQEVSGPVIAIAIILAAVFLPTAFIPGITGRLYQQFAVTIAVSVIISAFNALTLSPGACRRCCSGPRRKAPGRCRSSSTGSTSGLRPGDRRLCGRLPVSGPQERLRDAVAGGRDGAGRAAGQILATSFLPDEDQGYVFGGIQLPNTASLQRNDELVRQAEEILKNTPGVKYYSIVIGYSMLSGVYNTYSSFFFITL